MYYTNIFSPQQNCILYYHTAMKEDTNFDVLIVYSGGIAKSASINDSQTPFSQNERGNYNVAYAYFMDECRRSRISVALASSSDVIGPGLCKAYWTLYKDEWVRHEDRAFSTLIFDKLSPVNSIRKLQRDLLFSLPTVKSYSDTFLFELFFDKQLTHDTLLPFSLPTISLDSSDERSVEKGIALLRSLSNAHYARDDFGRSFILKDRYGAGGNNIFQITKDHNRNIRAIMKANPTISFILQPFISFQKGYSYKDSNSAIDIRIIFEGEKIVQTYIRMANAGDFRCNEHQGGTLIYTFQKEIPRSVLQCARKIAKFLGKKYALYALDFIVSDRGTIFLLEGNNGPGLDWNLSLKNNEQKSKKLIRVIVKELQARSEIQKAALLPTLLTKKSTTKLFLEN